MNLETWSVKHAKEILNNDDESQDELIVYAPEVFNFIQRMMRVNIGGGSDDIRESFQIEKYKKHCIARLNSSHEFTLTKLLHKHLTDSSNVALTLSYLYPSYVVELMQLVMANCQQNSL